MKYPVSNYRIVVHQHPEYNTTEIIAMSTYAGDTIKGKAICHINDNYDEKAGTELAVARCSEKIARKRKARATRLLKFSKEQLAEAQRYVDKMTHYYEDACAEADEATAEVADILAKM
jgi:hypothetical protein